MKRLGIVGLALIGLAVFAAAPTPPPHPRCDPRFASCSRRYADQGVSARGLAVAMPSALAELALAAGPDQGIQGASNPVALQGDYAHPEETELTDVGADVVHAFSAGHYLLVGLLLSFGGLLLLRKLAPVGGKLEVWLHGGVGLWLWGSVSSIVAVLITSVAAAGGTVDLKTLGSLAFTAVGTVLFAKVKDSSPTPAAQAVRAAKAGGSLAAG